MKKTTKQAPKKEVKKVVKKETPKGGGELLELNVTKEMAKYAQAVVAITNIDWETTGYQKLIILGYTFMLSMVKVNGNSGNKYDKLVTELNNVLLEMYNEEKAKAEGK